MKTTFTLLTMAILALFSFNVNSQNLLSGWEGNGITGDGSQPNEVGWANNRTSIPWADANTGGGCRFRDSGAGYTAGNYTMEVVDSVITTRQFMLRYDNAAYSTSVYSYPVTLEALATYTFSWDFVMGGSATPPLKIRLGFGLDTTKVGRIVTHLDSSTTSATKYRHSSWSFTTTTAGQYYLTIDGDFGWWGANNLSLTKLVTGLNTIANKLSVETYPNPVVKDLKVSLGNNVNKGTIEIYAITGAKINEYKLNSNQKTIDMSKYSSGTYIIKAVTNEGTSIKKIIKK